MQKYVHRDPSHGTSTIKHLHCPKHVRGNQQHYQLQLTPRTDGGNNIHKGEGLKGGRGRVVKIEKEIRKDMELEMINF